MKNREHSCTASRGSVAVGLLLLLGLAVSPRFAAAQEPTVLRELRNLGGPRAFSPEPLTTADDLRRFFRVRRADVAEVLEKGGWEGDAADFFRAVDEGPITERTFPVGGKLRWMAFRKPKEADVIRDVLWAGEAPFEAFEIRLLSNDWRWAFIVPKACGNLALFSRLGTAELTVAVSSGVLQLTDPEGRETVVRGGESATVSAPRTVPGGPQAGQAGVETTLEVATGEVEFRDYDHPITATLAGGNAVTAVVDRSGQLALSVPATNPGPLPVRVGDATGTLSAGSGMAAGWTPPVCSLSVAPASDCVDQPFAFDASASSVSHGEVATVELELTRPDAGTEMLVPERPGHFVWGRSFRQPGTYRLRAVAVSDRDRRSEGECAATFEVRACLPGEVLRTLTIDPRRPDVFYAGTRGLGMYKSTDGGVNWEAASSGLTDLKVEALGLDPASADTLYAGTFGGGVFKSTDGGGTWRAAGDGLTHTAVLALAIDPQEPATLYAGTLSGGVYKSIDGGELWAFASSGLTNLNVEALAIDPQEPSTLYAGTDGGGVFKSTDGGASWKSVDEGQGDNTVVALAIDPQAPGTLYAGTAGGVFKSTDGAATWSAAIRGLSSTRIRALAIDPRSPATLYVATAAGVSKSVDGGARWQDADHGLADADVFVLAIDPETPGTLYAGTFGGGLFKSTDGAASWVPAARAGTEE